MTASRSVARTGALGGLAIAGLMAMLVACAAQPSDGEAIGEESALTNRPTRDWNAHPAILEIDQATEIYALSDVHGGYVQLGRLLQKYDLISGFDPSPDNAEAAEWTGKRVILVVAGDVVDKGVESLAAVDLLRSLEAKAAQAGGRVIVTMGNHEAEFLDDPLNDKALARGEDGVGISVQLQAKGIDPKAVALGKDREGRGAWLLGLPFAVRIKKWFFSHGGNTDGDSIKDLRKKLEKGVDSKDGYGHKHITGKESILEAQDWYGGGKGKDYAEKLGVKHLVFGHDPGALDDRGRILAAQGSALVKLNVNMGLAHESNALVGGALLHVNVKPDAPDTAEALDANGTETPLF